jgi:hypothetical protein
MAVKREVEIAGGAGVTAAGVELHEDLRRDRQRVDQDGDAHGVQQRPQGAGVEALLRDIGACTGVEEIIPKRASAGFVPKSCTVDVGGAQRPGLADPVSI